MSPDRTSGVVSDDDPRVQSAETNYLEKAYADLEREI